MPEMATINDVAQRAGVSTYTVSAVLNRSARVSETLTSRVLEAVRELDYTINGVARSLQTRKTQTVGMLIPDIANPFYAKVVRGVEDVCKAHNYSLFLGNTYNQVAEQSRYLTVFRSRQVDALLLFVSAGEESGLRPLIQNKTPIVFVGRRPSEVEADCVTSDNRLGTRLAVDHLISRGHRRIAVITGHRSLSVSSERVEGWRQSLRKAKIPADSRLVCEGDWGADSAYRHAILLIEGSNPPTAFFAANFMMMTGVLRALKEKGIRCPDQIEVMSSDDSEWLDVFDPPISVVLQPSYEMGTVAAELIFRRLEEPGCPTKQVVLRPSLKLRGGANT
jgi:DNA-binding LacI/PurR family transcriptional regulator